MTPDLETTSERVAIVVWYLAFNLGLSTKEVAKITGMKKDSALRMMYRISRVLPIYQDDAYIWRKCETTSDTVSYLT